MIKKNKERQGKQSKVIRGTRRSNAVRGEAGTRKPAGSDQEAAAAAEKPSDIPVIGLGGSAGSLEAFKTFFTAMPSDSGAAFVVIQHLAPTHESLLAELLAQQTRMRVIQARDAMPVETNSVYVIPPNQYIAIRGGVLRLTEPVKHDGVKMPIDFFFRSLSEDRRERAMSVLFSGAGSDGTLGVRAVRGTGGLVIAQDPRTAQFADMPRSAIATGLVDFVLSPDRMPETLLNYLRHPYVRGGEPADAVEVEGRPGSLQDILALVLARQGHDFRCYKRNTVLRRIERRMGLRGLPELAPYYALLRQDPVEVKELFKDLLINVTSFFRDAEAFEEFRQKAVAPLIDTKQSDDPLRVWVPGCSSGEEAYSLGMLLLEEMAASGKNCLLQIFATDIDEEALESARNGIYPESIAVDVRPERLSRFFVRGDRGYQVSESLRKSVTFAVQSIVADPPFSKMDIISCRNLLIYLDTDTQTRLMPLFNFALNPGGYLFLGKSEGISGQNDLFEIVSKKARIFRQLVPARPIVLDIPILPGRKMVMTPPAHAAIKPQASALADTIRQALLNHFAAAVVLVDRKGQILRFHGQTARYLNMPAAEPNLNLLEIAKEGLSAKLRLAMHNAVHDGGACTLDSVRVTRDKDGPFVRITVAPASQPGGAEPLLAVIFEDVDRPLSPVSEKIRGDECETVVRQLEDELTAAQQELQATIEELQAANEELRVSNEEVVSTNEELQSTVEELETSKEELQSVNEELTTVNTELQDKIQRLDEANSDLDNLLKSTEIATLFLDRELRIKLFTPAATRVVKLILSDTGRPISDLSLNFTGYDLPSDARAVVSGGGVIEREVRHTAGSQYLVRLMPYRNQNDRLDGIVVTFSDITKIKQAEKKTRRLATVLTDSNDAVLLFDRGGKILTWNRGASEMYGWSEAEALQMTIRDMMPPGRTSEVADLIRRLSARETVSSYETQRLAKDGRILDISLTATAVWDEAGKRVEACAATERDITERKRAEEEVKRLNKELGQKVSDLEAANKELEAFVYSVSHDLRAPLRTIAGFVKILGEDCIGQLDDQGRSYVDRIYEGAEKMSKLIEDLLYLSQISRQAINPSEFNMSNKVSSIIKELRERNPARSVEISIEEGLTAFADPGLTEIVLTNLLGNAWKFTSKTEKARIEFRSFRRDGKTVYYIRDNGVGFDPDYKEKLFLPFQRLHSDKEFEGTGIGLSIVARIVRRHGGQIWTESEIGKGVTVFFTFN
jgi:two-component system CheB/CheR fusion protein